MCVGSLETDELVTFERPGECVSMSESDETNSEVLEIAVREFYGFNL